MVALEVSIVTVRDIFQDEAGRHSRFSEEYRSKSAVIILDRQDLAGLGAKEGDLIAVENDTGSVVVAAVASLDDAHPGLAIMYNSPWSNQLVPEAVCQSSIPRFKSIRARVQSAAGSAAVTDISEIFSRIKG